MSTQTLFPEIATREFHPHQYVKVSVSPTKTEIGIVVSTNEHSAVVATRHGYNITVRLQQLQRAFLLVLDLNGVLGLRHGKAVFERRPHLERFLKFALTNFVVAVWTSCEERNGKQIVDDLFVDDRDRLLFCLYRGDCTPNPTPERPFGTIKNLQRIFDRWPESFHAVNTVIVDDSPDKCSHPDIALCPSAFTGLDNDAEDVGLLETITVLEKVLAADSLDPVIEAADARRMRQLQEDEKTSAEEAAAHAHASATISIPTLEAAACIATAQAVKAAQDKLTACCHFLQNTCRFGHECRFAHTDNGLMPCNRSERCKLHTERNRRASEHVAVPSVFDLKLAENQSPHRVAASSSATSATNINNFAALLLDQLNCATQEVNISVSNEAVVHKNSRHPHAKNSNHVPLHNQRDDRPSAPSVVSLLQSAHRVYQ